MKILLPVDGSAPALDAVRHALYWAAQGLRASYVLVNVQEPPSLYEVVTVHDAETIDRLRKAAGADILQPAEALLQAAGVDFESEVAGGVPAGILVELLENYGCAAVVMGARGVGDSQAGGLGSVAESMLLHSPVPVTLVRTPAPEPVGAGDAAEEDDLAAPSP